jgi:hypothetical protein
MADVVREKNRDGPLAAVTQADVAESRHVSPTSPEQSKQHVFNAFFQLIRLVQDKDRYDVLLSSKIECSKRLTENQVLTSPLSGSCFGSTLFRLPLPA